MKTRTGFVYRDRKTGNFYARICYSEENGKRTSVGRKVENISHGRQVLKELVATFDNGGREAFDVERMTFYISGIEAILNIKRFRRFPTRYALLRGTNVYLYDTSNAGTQGQIRG